MPPRLLHLLLPATALLLLLLLAHLLPDTHPAPSMEANITEVEVVEEYGTEEEESGATEEEVHTILYYTSWWPDHPSEPSFHSPHQLPQFHSDHLDISSQDSYNQTVTNLSQNHSNNSL